MNELKIFNNKEFGKIRTVTIDNEPWFVGKDVASSLGYERATKAIQDHVDSEDKDEVPIQDSIGRMQKTPIISESGLYALIFGSKLESAKRFKHWVTSEVLPALRKTGGYNLQQPQGKELLALAVLEAQKTIEEQTAQIEEMKPKAIFADAVATSHTSILIGDLAKILKQNGIETGQKRLFEWLRENGFLSKRKGAEWNSPTQKSMNLGLFEVKETTTMNPDGSVRINKTTKVTGKGQQYFINKFLNAA
ncbi:phage antirepressor [Mediterraneibacter gnavus]|uniref:phage antirepressor n=1 Tax=Mediterraneibacter gnavus TaxID=33038 RepID=UPI00232AE16A|nr:phage antirepressor [Mediterraneibacter gnavus]MDB8711642.1 phage antirepressor [Mediterraneibacter gnavus]MDB8714652.1 phage antirepressor [Mediterraneibacter gnavus]